MLYYITMANSPPTSILPGSKLSSRPRGAPNLEERLAILEERTAWLDEAREMAPRMMGTAGDVFDAFAERHNLDERMNSALELVERLTRPQTLSQLAMALEVAESLPKFLATVGDTVDGYADTAEANGVDLDSFAPRLGRLSTQLATALQSADRSEPAPAGIFALLREFRDPNVLQALGFALTFAKSFGSILKRQHQHALNESSQ